MSLTSVVLASPETSSALPWMIGGAVLVGLVAGMLALLIFGHGRPHS